MKPCHLKISDIISRKALQLTPMNSKCFILALLLLHFWLHVYAQKSSYYKMGIETQAGFIIAHSSDLIPVSQSNPIGIKFSYDRIRLDKEKWETCNCFHYLGLHLSHYNFNNPEVLGSATTVSGSFEPILWKNNHFQLTLYSGLGLSYLSSVYDEETNPTNSFFSAPVSFLLFVSPRFLWHFQENLSFNLSMNYNHISNGGQRQPNHGMNFPMIGIGLSYIPRTIHFPKYKPTPAQPGWNVYLEGFGTLRENPSGDGRLPALGISLGSYYRTGNITGLGGGLESGWDRSIIETSKTQTALTHAVYFAHHLLFGRFDFNQRMALYLHKPQIYQPDKSFYQRYSLTYQVTDHLKLGTSLKAHGHVAENIEFRMGYVF